MQLRHRPFRGANGNRRECGSALADPPSVLHAVQDDAAKQRVRRTGQGRKRGLDDIDLAILSRVCICQMRCCVNTSVDQRHSMCSSGRSAHVV